MVRGVRCVVGVVLLALPGILGWNTGCGTPVDGTDAVVGKETPLPACPPPNRNKVIIPVYPFIKMDGLADDWKKLKPLATSPRGARCKGKKAPSHDGLDLKAVYMARWDKSWYFAVETQAFFPDSLRCKRNSTRDRKSVV